MIITPAFAARSLASSKHHLKVSASVANSETFAQGSSNAEDQHPLTRENDTRFLASPYETVPIRVTDTKLILTDSQRAHDAREAGYFIQIVPQGEHDLFMAPRNLETGGPEDH